jgi:hypothetical protein
MRTEDRPDPHRHGEEIDTQDIRNPETVHEERDVNVRGILLFGLWLFIAAVIIHIALWGFFRILEHETAKRDPRPTPVAEQRSNKFPEPKLQPNPVGDVQRMRQREGEQLHQYGWVNRQQGVTHIPIERAMELLAQRGLPSRQAQPQQMPGNLDPSGGEGPNQPVSASPSRNAHGQREAEGKPATPATREAEKPRRQQ